MNHLPRRPDIYMYRDGYEHLNRVLDLFEETILSRNIKDKSPEKIERMKRYFIYSLIGLDNPDYYKHIVESKLRSTNRYIVDSETDLELLRIQIDILNRKIAGEEISQEDESIIEPARPLFNSLEEYLNSRLDKLSKTSDVIKLLKSDLKDMEEMLEFVNKYVITDSNR